MHLPLPSSSHHHRDHQTMILFRGVLRIFSLSTKRLKVLAVAVRCFQVSRSHQGRQGGHKSWEVPTRRVDPCETLSSVCIIAKHWKTIKGTGVYLVQSNYVHVESRNVNICLTCNITFWVEGVPRRGYSSKKWKHKFSVNQCRLHILLSHATVNVQLQRTMGKDVIFHVSWWETLYAMCLFSVAFAFNVFCLIPIDIIDDHTHSSN